MTMTMTTKHIIIVQELLFIITQALGETTNFGHHIIWYPYPPIWVKGQGLGRYTWVENSLI